MRIPRGHLGRIDLLHLDAASIDMGLERDAELQELRPRTALRDQKRHAS